MSQNLLQNETSPYLLQHKDNPIAWRSWGPAAFAEARDSGKPIFLSVGYSTCHWCHVMAHESFEDQEVADVLNKNFISIKVDREERPDVDQIYMSALQALSGGGGWPMSVWLTPEGKPFFAGTYFPKYRFLQLLRRIQEIWITEQGKLLEDGERLTATIAKMSESTRDEDEGQEAEQEEFLKAYITHLQHHFDEVNGGFGAAPKFPQTMNLMVMMRQDSLTGLNQAETMVTTTLDKMVRGGIRDHLIGGFHRYSVDEKWLVPHFEKMLYDQALISVTLLEAYQLYGGEEFALAARETFDYVLREMTHAHGGFYSAQDADSIDPENGKSEEGYFCTYDYAELRQFLSETELETLAESYGVSPSGNFEGRNILHLPEGAERPDDIEEIFLKLAKLRASRPVPHLDDKIVVAWNGWMIWAFAKASVVLKDERYLKAAQKALTFLKENLGGAKQLHRFWREGNAKGSAMAEDYCSLIHACLEVYQVDFDAKWADWALELQQELDRRYWDSDEGNYFSNDGQDSLLPLRPKDDYDGVTPSSNSMAAYNLSRLYLLTGEIKFEHQAERLMQSYFPKLKRFPSGLPFLALAMDFRLSEASTAVFNGEGWAKEALNEARAKYAPHRLWARADEKSWPVARGKVAEKDAVYICTASACQSPLTNKNDAVKALKENL